jgi:hypothetical protein
VCIATCPLLSNPTKDHNQMRKTMQGQRRTHRELVGAPSRKNDLVEPQQPQVPPRRTAKNSNFPLLQQRIKLNP